MCGEQLTVAVTVVPVEGSSPRVRGAVYCAPRLGVVEGIIPACAGSSRFRHQGKARCRGSSPRVRGAVCLPRWLLVYHGIIPACAGSSWSSRSGPRRGRDHPRVCGEQPPNERVVPCPTGSSPRVRGAAISYALLLAWHRIIPACAGSSDSGRCYPLLARDHPRVCGEQVITVWITGHTAGSSPRVRGAG